MAKSRIRATEPAPQDTVPPSSAGEPDPLQPFRSSFFTEPVTELEKLLSQSRRVFLMGAGCSKCAGLPLMPELTGIVLNKLEAKPEAHAVLQALQSNFENATNCTIEDYMSELVDLVCIADRRERRAAKNPTVALGTNSYSPNDLLQALAEIKDAIAEAISQTNVKIDVHRQFVRTIHGTLQSGKSGVPHQVDYFILNYDTLVEDALALERTPLADGFNGGVTGWWDASAYTTSPAHARVFKVHGSIDWCLCDNDVLPRRIRHGLGVDGQRERVLIWPASTKYRETQRDPYAQIIGFMRQALRPQSGSEVVLTVCGYAFGDTHINIEIDRALHESEKRLTLIVFTSEDTPMGQLKEWLDDPLVSEQVRIHANRGFFHAAKSLQSDAPLLWWRFEVLTRLLGGQR